MTKLSKAERIMALHAKGLSTREIALAVYGEITESRKAYVRIVKGQRKGRARSPVDMRYFTSDRARTTRQEYHRYRYSNDPEYKRKCIDGAVAWQRANPERRRANVARYLERRRRLKTKACGELTNHPINTKPRV